MNTVVVAESSFLLQQYFQQKSAGALLTPADYQNLLKAARQYLYQQFEQQVDIQALLYEHAALMDQILEDRWRQYFLYPKGHGALIAVGGYGRQELHPASDIDLLVLLEKEPDPLQQEKLSAFLTFLWDIGLDVGHSVRTLSECLQSAEADLTVITNLLESRLLCGDQGLYQQLKAGIRPAHIWDSRAFFIAKLEEQEKRYQKFGDTAYRVEPNLKEGPGGLRDIHMITWILEREYGQLSLLELYERNLLELEEYECLREGRALLWRVRFMLHHLAGRKEDRLLFDYQHALAQAFGHQQEKRNAAVEAFMHHYYKTITDLERLTDVLLGVFRRELLQQNMQPNAMMLGNWYTKQGKLLAVNSPDTFVLYPTALLEIFLVLQTTTDVSGLAPETIRLMRQNLHRIDNGFRQQAWHRQIFMQILRQPNGVTRVFRLMNRYGVLAAYLPIFANIVGRMQYDLFHAYTVDEHTLFVLSNVRSYSTSKGMKEMPFASQVFGTLPKPEILYLAALFHDIGKGRQGDHSELGAQDAMEFCREHGLNLHDSSLVSWLVRYHLLMSVTAQRKDISDPAVIHQFASIVIDQTRLDYLFLLTIADIKGTNPKLWNSWKQSLLNELYQSTRYLLREHVLLPAETQALIDEKRFSALDDLEEQGFAEAQCQQLWQQLGDDYLLKHSVESICWHTHHILTSSARVLPLVDMRVTSSGSSNALFVYSQSSHDLFMRVVSTLEQLRLNVVQARLVSMHGKNRDLYTLHILGSDNQIITDVYEKQSILKTIHANLVAHKFKPVRQRNLRILRNFDVPTRVSFRQQVDSELTIMEVRASDRPGLLSRIGEVLAACYIRVHGAQINTLGEQAEDLFYISSWEGKTVDDEKEQSDIRDALIHILDN